MSKVYSLKCPNCAGALELMGGGRVQTTTCPYCKSVIDLNDNYKVLYNFKNSVVPEVPFEIGMRGKIEDIEWTIIGWIVYRSEDDVNDKWSEFLLFSPFYGYAWLVYEEGEISFSKRVRDFNIQKWEKNGSTTFYRKGHYILEEEPYNALIYFVQGELTWVAKKNDKTRYWEYKKTTKESLSIEQSHGELEVYYIKRLNTKEIYESFGVKSESQVIKDRSFSEKIDEELEEGNRSYIYGLIFIAILLLGGLISSLTSDRALSTTVKSKYQQDFKIKDSSFLNQITIQSSQSKTLNGYRVAIYKDSREIFHIDKKEVYFKQKPLGKTWNSVAIGTNIYLNLEKGEYLLKVTKLDRAVISPITIIIKERIVRVTYILPVFAFILLFLLYIKFRNMELKYIVPFGMMISGILFDIPNLFPIGFFLLVIIIMFNFGSKK